MTTRTDEEKLRALLPHWIEHNAEDAAEFRNWEERARDAGHEGVGRKIAEAATQLEKVNEALAAALEILAQPG